MKKLRKRKTHIVYHAYVWHKKKKKERSTYLYGRNGGADVRTDLWTQLREERGGQTEKVALTFIHDYV